MSGSFEVTFRHILCFGAFSVLDLEAMLCGGHQYPKIFCLHTEGGLSKAFLTQGHLWTSTEEKIENNYVLCRVSQKFQITLFFSVARKPFWRETFFGKRRRNALERKILTGFIEANNSGCGAKPGNRACSRFQKPRSPDDIVAHIARETAVKFFFGGNCSNKSCSSSPCVTRNRNQIAFYRQRKIGITKKRIGLSSTKKVVHVCKSRNRARPEIRLRNRLEWEAMGGPDIGKWVLISLGFGLGFKQKKEESETRSKDRFPNFLFLCWWFCLPARCWSVDFRNAVEFLSS